jgi:hypothetical protein
MSDSNPFAPLPSGSPSGTVLYDRPGEIFQSGGVIQSPLIATWPPRCVKCNRDVSGPFFRAKMTWYPRWTIIVFVLSRLIGLILMMIKRRTVVLELGLCDEHRALRKRNMLIGVGVMGLGVLLFAAGIQADAVPLLLGGPVALIVGIVVTAMGHATVRVQKVEGEVAYIKASDAFTASLPG